MPTPANLYRLPRTVIELSGADALPYLSSLVPSDLAPLAIPCSLYTVLLTPQGKISFDLFITTSGQGTFWMDIHQDHAARALALFKRYSLRRQVQLVPRDDLAVIADLANTTDHQDPRGAHMGARAVLPATTPASTDIGPYLDHQMALGLWDMADIAPDAHYPHETNLDQLGVLSFTKGCYLGQEMVARIEHRHLLKRRILCLQSTTPLHAGQTVTLADGTVVGEILAARAPYALAKLLLSATAQPLLCEGQPVAPN